ncbi:MAG: DUF58 domain-containing protein [Bacillota bacterium]
MVAVRDRRYFVLAVLALALARFVGGPLPYFLLYVFSGILLVSYAWAVALTRNLSLSYDLDRQRVSSGQSITVRLKLYNDGFYPLPWATLTDHFAALVSGEAAPVLHLNPGPLSSAVTSYSLTCRRRGHYMPGPVELVTGDPFGIFRVRLNFQGSGHLTVYPRLVVVDHLPVPVCQPFGRLRTRQKAFEDPSNPAELRPFRHGDNPRRIHWRTSAHLQSPYVVEYELTATTQMHIFLDLATSAVAETTKDMAVEVALAIAHYALRRGFDIGLVAHGSDRFAIPSGKGQRKLYEYLEGLARVTADGRVPLAQVLAVESRHLPLRSTIAVVTPSLSPELVLSLLRLATGGFGVILFLIGPAQGTSTGYLRQAGIDVLILNRTEDLLTVGGVRHATGR